MVEKEYHVWIEKLCILQRFMHVLLFENTKNYSSVLCGNEWNLVSISLK